MILKLHEVQHTYTQLVMQGQTTRELRGSNVVNVEDDDNRGFRAFRDD